MKDNNGRSLARYCQLLGISRQAYYQHFKEDEAKLMKEEIVLEEVRKIRSKHRRLGGKKVFKRLGQFLIANNIKMGRDAFFDLMKEQGLLIKRKRRKTITTFSLHRFRKYPNKIKGIVLSGPNQLWVSDITYWKIENSYLYVSLITDAYSRKIVGYHVSASLEALETLKALKMALGGLKRVPENLIHHSDRGLQYCSNEYVKLLRAHQIEISMTENGDPYENALAERMNGILKEEYLNEYKVETIDQARMTLAYAVDLYNIERPHLSWNYQTPAEVHSNSEKKERDALKRY